MWKTIQDNLLIHFYNSLVRTDSEDMLVEAMERLEENNDVFVDDDDDNHSVDNQIIFADDDQPEFNRYVLNDVVNINIIT